jgi:hypothetical protein
MSYDNRDVSCQEKMWRKMIIARRNRDYFLTLQKSRIEIFQERSSGQSLAAPTRFQDFFITRLDFVHGKSFLTQMRKNLNIKKCISCTI